MPYNKLSDKLLPGDGKAGVTVVFFIWLVEVASFMSSVILTVLVSVGSVVVRVIRPVVTGISVVFKLDVVFVIFLIAIEVIAMVKILVAM